MSSTLLRATVLAAALVGSLVAQVGSRNNASLLGRFAPPGFDFIDIWGYVSPTGGEYAILGASSGTFIVDCTDPRNPVQRAFFPGADTPYRDARSYRNYVYVVSGGDPGMQIIDMSDPDQPVLVQTWGTNLWGDCHNVSIDKQTGILYACGTPVGTPIVDLSIDPANPTLVGYGPWNYTHDLQVQDGLAHVSEITTDTYVLSDVAQLPTVYPVGSVFIDACHNAWPTRDNRYVLTSTEALGADPPGSMEPIPGGGLTVLDISDPFQPTPIAEWRLPGSGISIHNVYALDRVCHISYYSEGYRALDLTDPANPVVLAHYDTSPLTGGLTGAWGCYPFQPSGVIYISDQQQGLHILQTPTSARIYGESTPGTKEAPPQLRAFGAPFVGNARFGFEVLDAAPNAPATLVLSASPADIQISGVQINVELGAWIAIEQATTNARGRALWSVPLPGEFGKIEIYGQAFVLDPNGTSGWATSRGIESTTFDL